MAKTTDPVALNQWYAVETLTDLAAALRRTRLLGQDIACNRDQRGQALAHEVATDGEPGPALPTLEHYGCLWTTLGSPARPLFEIGEAAGPDRRMVPCGWTRMRASGPRVAENFLDMARFPFVHADILGAEPHIAVPRCHSEIRRDADEVWASNCQLFQPRIAASESAGAFAQLSCRVPTPFAVVLYRVCPSAPARLDVIALSIQPLEEDVCRAQPVMHFIDTASALTELLRFEQVIFLQDRIIVENQRPVLLPLDPRSEIPTRADSSSIVYRRWLKEKGLRYGTAAPG